MIHTISGLPFTAFHDDRSSIVVFSERTFLMIALRVAARSFTVIGIGQMNSPGLIS
jgi:hypothetical protein